MEGDIESNNLTNESRGMSQMNVDYIKSILQTIHLSTDEVSQQCLHHQEGPILQLPIKSLFLNGRHVVHKMSQPSFISWTSSFTEMQDLVREVVSHVTAEFICDLLRSCSSSVPAEECNILSELSQVLSSLTSAPESATAILPTWKASHDGSDLEDVDESANRGTAADSASETALQCSEDVKLESIEPCIGNRRGSIRHFYEFTKNVPAAIAFCRRGVRCKICFYLYKGPSCVDRLVKHTKVKHPHMASPKHLTQLRENNSLQKIIGDGMRICRCQMCTYNGPGSLLM